MSLVSEQTTTVDHALAIASKLLATNPALAGQQASEVLKVVDNHPMALLVLGASYSARGKPQLATEILEPLSIAQPNSAMTHMELGIALGRAGRGDESLKALRHAASLKPNLPRVWLALGDQLSAMGDARGADAAYASHIRYSITDPRLLAAGSALSEGRLPEAETLLRAHLMQAPTDVAAIRMLAEIAARLGRYEDAENLLSRCLELAPSFREARQNYALVLQRHNKHEQALAELDALLKNDPRNPGCRILKAAVFSRLGDYEAAIELYADLVRDYPKNTKIWMSYGHTLKTAGHQHRAIQAYRRSIELDPGFGDAYWSLANLKTFRFNADEIETMRGMLRRTDLATEHRFHFEFALAKALEDAAEYAESFEHYLQGNAQRLAEVPYSANENAARVARTKRVYTRAFFDQRRGSGSQAPDPIFIVGLPRAGSTLIEQILSSHSAVEGTMELPEIISMTRALRAGSEPGAASNYHDALARLGSKELEDLGQQYLDRTRVQRKFGAPLFIDKMPNNFAHIGLIHLTLPNAKIIDARRHPLACCLSAFKQHFAQGQNFTYSLDDIGRYYSDYVELMAHFDDVLPGRVHRVIYENMVDDTEAEVRRLLAYCGLPFESGCLRFFENDRPVRTASSEQVRQPIYREGIEHWRHFEPWLGPLKASLGPVLDTYPAAPDFHFG
jgi:tetratricopeptide (TPR) repeat protein